MVPIWSPSSAASWCAAAWVGKCENPLTWAYCSVSAGFVTVDLLRRYSNRPDLLEQLRTAGVILSGDGHGGNTGAEVATEGVVRSRRLRDRFSPQDLQAMIDLYRSGTTAKQVAEKFGVSLRSVKRLLHQHGIRRERRRGARSARD